MRRGSAVHGEQHASDSICGFDRRPSVKSLNSSSRASPLEPKTQPTHGRPYVGIAATLSPCPQYVVGLQLRKFGCLEATVRAPAFIYSSAFAYSSASCNPLSPLCAHATSSQGITDTLQSTIQSPPDPRGPRFCLAHQIGVIDVHEVRVLSKWSLLACIPGR